MTYPATVTAAMIPPAIRMGSRLMLRKCVWRRVSGQATAGLCLWIFAPSAPNDTPFRGVLAIWLLPGTASGKGFTLASVASTPAASSFATEWVSRLGIISGMTISEQVQKDMVAAMRAREERRLSTLRMMKTALKNKEIDKRSPLDERESLAV